MVEQLHAGRETETGEREQTQPLMVEQGYKREGGREGVIRHHCSVSQSLVKQAGRQ